MTGNSMDAIDLVLTEFDGDKMTDICSFSQPYSKQRQEEMEKLRASAKNKTKAEIMALPDFKRIHDEYIKDIAACINEMCRQNNIDKNTIDAIGFHGKTLDHNPPSKAKTEGSQAYTLQIGSGKMLADLTDIKVIYDFRSAPLMSGFDGAPLVPPHNAHIAATEGDGCYYNGGNTSNFAWIVQGKAQIGADAGPFNEYVDNYIRNHTADSFDVDGKYGKNGKINTKLLQEFFDIGRDYYERSLPKSGDPQFYYKDKIFAAIDAKKIKFNDAVCTMEYFAAYIAVQALTLTSTDIELPPHFILFGGGWKNPVVHKSFADLLQGKGFVLPEHQKSFKAFRQRFNSEPTIKYSSLGEMMEARLFADLARYKLENKAWEIPEIVQSGKKIICGVAAEPQAQRHVYDDMINLAAKGWQKTNRIMQKKDFTYV